MARQYMLLCCLLIGIIELVIPRIIKKNNIPQPAFTCHIRFENPLHKKYLLEMKRGVG